MTLNDRELARYWKLRGELRMTATEALANVRVYCAISDEQHAANVAALSAQLAEARARVCAEGWTFALTFPEPAR